MQVAEAIEKKQQDHKPNLYIDISEIVRQDRETGIQRVIKGIIYQGIDLPVSTKRRIEPIYLLEENHYYSRNYLFNKLNANNKITPDLPVIFKKNDNFLGLDLTINQHPILNEVLSKIKHNGTKVYFALFDLLPIILPSTFYKSVVNDFTLWIEEVTKNADGLICISRSVADELFEWLNKNQPDRSTPLKIGYFHLGSDIHCCKKESLFNEDQAIGLMHTKTSLTVLMVGTLEPRKGYAQTIFAFERLWKDGIDIKLVIVGQEGWMMEKLV